MWNQARVQKIKIIHKIGFLLYNQASGSDYSKIMYSLFSIKGEINERFSFVLCFPEILNRPQNPCVDL
jgi:hypothetical protein